MSYLLRSRLPTPPRHQPARRNERPEHLAPMDLAEIHLDRPPIPIIGNRESLTQRLLLAVRIVTENLNPSSLSHSGRVAELPDSWQDATPNYNRATRPSTTPPPSANL